MLISYNLIKIDEYFKSITCYMVTVIMSSFVSIFSASSLEIYLITNLWDLFICCSLNSCAASKMNSIILTGVISNVNEISVNFQDLSIENTEIGILFLNSFTTELSFHNVHIVAVSCTVWDAKDFDPCRRENGNRM